MERKELKKKPLKEVKMDMTPMIDVVFLLIIFFMLVTEMTKAEIEVVILPYASMAKEDKGKNQKRVIINLKSSDDRSEHGKIIVLGKRYNPGTLKKHLEDVVASTGLDDQQLAILAVKFRADANLEWKYIQDAIWRMWWRPPALMTSNSRSWP